MGYGKKLKEYIDKKGTNVRKIAKETGISATTLYSIIQRDTRIRLDYAIKIANVLDIDISEINDEILLPDTEMMPPHGISNSTYNTLLNLDKKQCQLLDEVLRNFFILDDDGREQILVLVKCMKRQQERKEITVNDNL